MQPETVAVGASGNDQKVSGPSLPKSGAVAMFFRCLFRPFVAGSNVFPC